MPRVTSGKATTMPEDMVTVPADTLHAVLGVFARIAHLAESPAVRELREAVPEPDRVRAQLFALQANLPAIRRALTIAAAEATYEVDAKPYRDALQALGGEE